MLSISISKFSYMSLDGNNFFQAVASALLMSVLSFTGVFLFVIRGARMREYFLVLSAVVLLYDALFHLLPEALEARSSPRTWLLVAFGAAITTAINWFFHDDDDHNHGHVVEKKNQINSRSRSRSRSRRVKPDAKITQNAVVEHVKGKHKRGLGYANLVGEAVHNFIDGLALGVSWMTGTQAGISTTIAIAAHELPQEIGDCAILLAAGFSARRLLTLNFAVSLTCLLGVLVAYWLGSAVTADLRGILLPITAGSFMAFALFILQPILKSGGMAAALAVVGISVAVGHGFMFPPSHDHPPHQLHDCHPHDHHHAHHFFEEHH